MHKMKLSWDFGGTLVSIISAFFAIIIGYLPEIASIVAIVAGIGSIIKIVFDILIKQKELKIKNHEVEELEEDIKGTE